MYQFIPLHSRDYFKKTSIKINIFIYIWYSALKKGLFEVAMESRKLA